MPNMIEYASVFQSSLDKAAVEVATSGWMEENAGQVKYTGGRKIEIPSMNLDGMADYDRDGAGFVDGSINLEYEQKTMSQDRGRRFTFDENDVDESGFVVTASEVLGEFQREKVVPEMDAYRYSSIVSQAIAANRARGGLIVTAANVLNELLADIAAIEDEVGEIPLVITISRPIATLLDTSEKIQKQLQVTDFRQGDISLKVQSLNGQYPLVRVPSGRMKTKYIFNDGKTAGQEKGGFIPAPNAKNINWLITARRAPLAVSKTDNVRIFDPETYQPKRAWAVDYRRYHDLWIAKKKLQEVFANTKEV